MKSRRVLTPEELKVLREMSGVRLPFDMMATLLGMSHDTLNRLYKQSIAVRASIDEGRASASNTVRKTLFITAVGRQPRTIVDPETGERRTDPGQSPDVQAMRFWCETQEGFKRAEALELTGAGGGPIITADVGEAELRAVYQDPEAIALARSLALKMSVKKPQ